MGVRLTWLDCNCSILSNLLSPDGLARYKKMTRFSLFVSYCYVVRYCLKCFVSFILPRQSSPDRWKKTSVSSVKKHLK